MRACSNLVTWSLQSLIVLFGLFEMLSYLDWVRVDWCLRFYSSSQILLPVCVLFAVLLVYAVVCLIAGLPGRNARVAHSVSPEMMPLLLPDVLFLLQPLTGLYLAHWTAVCHAFVVYLNGVARWVEV